MASRSQCEKRLRDQLGGLNCAGNCCGVSCRCVNGANAAALRERSRSPTNLSAPKTGLSLISDAVLCCLSGVRLVIDTCCEPRIDMNCPVCLGSATNTTPPEYGGMVIECGRCGTYRVTRDALAGLPSLMVADRLAALLTAKRVVSRKVIPTISTGCLKLDRGKA